MKHGALKYGRAGPTVAARGEAYAAAPGSTLRKFTYFA
jgi:hypothetical protein